MLKCITANYIVYLLVQMSYWHYDMMMLVMIVCQLAMSNPPTMMNRTPWLMADREDWVDS